MARELLSRVITSKKLNNYTSLHIQVDTNSSNIHSHKYRYCEAIMKFYLADDVQIAI